MKLKSLALLLLIIGVSCSSPKYTYNFSYHDSQAGKKKAVQPEMVAASEINSSELTASTTTSTAVLSEEKAPLVAEQKGITSLNTTEQKALRKEIKNTIKTAVKQVKKMDAKSSSAASGWDRDLKLAAIFGAVGIGLGLLYSVNTIVGFIGFAAIVIALFFLIRWLMRQ